MFMRKLNAGVSLLTTVLLLDHAIFLSIWMLSRGSIAKSSSFMPWVLVGSMVLHAIISIDQAISAHANLPKQKVNQYPKLNKSTMVQRISGIAMAILLVVHIAGAANHFQPKILHAILHPLFFAIVLIHVAVSTSKSLITLGIGNAKFIRIVDISIKVICAITLVLGIIGFYLCLFMWVAK